ncbi:MAG: DMT family transporter [Erysipelotrichaceae bacterium]|nr:DMT family transporter [Erysipelotrichaceae bacterium]
MKKYIGVLTLLGVAVIFGMAFSFQSIASSYLSPFSLNGLRFLMAGIVLSPIFLIKDNTDTRTLIKAGILDGILLFGATNLQQTAIEVTSAGKAGFLTAMYIVLVPVFAFLFLKRKLHLHVIISVLLSLVGLYLLCGLSLSDLQLRVSDLFLIGCAMIFAIQILVVEHYVDKVHPIKMSTLAFLVAGVLCIPFVLVKETITMDAFLKALPSLLYLSLASTCLGYTFQAVGQKLVDATPAALLMSLESVFSAVGGYLLLHQVLSTRELLGAVVMFTAVILCQLPIPYKKGK